MDNIYEKLNRYASKEKAAIENWKKLKFRLLIISKFSSLSVLKKKLETVDEDSDNEDRNLKPTKKIKWYIISADGKNKQIWNMFTNVFYMIAFFNLPIVIAFDFVTLED